MRLNHFFRIATFFMAFFVSPVLLFAAAKPAPKVTGSGNGAAAAAKANEALEKAKANLNDLTNKMRTKFEASPEYVAAVADVKKSTAAYNTASAKFIATLQTSPEYQSLVAAKVAAQAKVDTMRKDSAVKADALAAAQADAIEATKAVTKYQTDAMNADSALSLLKDDVLLSTHNLATMKRHFESTLADDSAWAAAKTDVDRAEARLAAARARL